MFLSLIFAANVFATPEHQMPGPKAGSPEFEKIKTLAGTWKGTAKTGDELTDAVVEYKVTSNGSAVIETLFPGTPHEMVSVYHDNAKGNLTMTHYCAFGNRPQLDLVESDQEHLNFELSPSSEIPAEENHMHSLNLDFKDGGLKQTWTCNQQGKTYATTTIVLKKV